MWSAECAGCAQQEQHGTGPAPLPPSGFSWTKLDGLRPLCSAYRPGICIRVNNALFYCACWVRVSQKVATFRFPYFVDNCLYLLLLRFGCCLYLVFADAVISVVINLYSVVYGYVIKSLFRSITHYRTH